MVGGAFVRVTLPTCILCVLCDSLDMTLEASLDYNPFTREWAVQRSDEGVATTELASKLKTALQV